jgi:hypothetical protein
MAWQKQTQWPGNVGGRPTTCQAGQQQLSEQQRHTKCVVIGGDTRVPQKAAACLASPSPAPHCFVAGEGNNCCWRPGPGKGGEYRTCIGPSLSDPAPLPSPSHPNPGLHTHFAAVATAAAAAPRIFPYEQAKAATFDAVKEEEEDGNFRLIRLLHPPPSTATFLLHQQCRSCRLAFALPHLPLRDYFGCAGHWLLLCWEILPGPCIPCVPFPPR